MYVCMYVCMCVCMYVYVYVSWIHSISLPFSAGRNSFQSQVLKSGSEKNDCLGEPKAFLPC